MTIPTSGLRLFFDSLAMNAPASLLGMVVRQNLTRAQNGIFVVATRQVRLLFNFNMVAAANSASLNNPAQQAAPPAKRFLKTLADLIHLVTRCTRLRHFEQCLSCAEMLAAEQSPKRDAACGDVFPGAPGRDAKFLQRF